MYEDPQMTIELLRQLVDRYEMENEHFQAIHHFGRGATISGHVAYASRLQRDFREHGTNATVAQRLEICLNRRAAKSDWTSAIAEALQTFPIPHRN